MLRRLTEPTAEGLPKDASDVLRARLEAYKTGAAALPPEKAAAEWIQLLDGYLSLSRQSRMGSFNSSSQFSAESILEVLPPISAWDALAEELQTRSASGKTLAAAAQNLLGSLLAADPAGRLPALARLKETIAKDSRMESYHREQFDEQLSKLEEHLSPPGSPSTDPVAKLSKLLDQQLKPEYLSYRAVVVPKLPDTPEAREALLRLLKADLMVEFEDEATRQFVASFAKEQLEKLPEPPWKLILSTRDIPLFEAAAKLRPEAAKTLVDGGKMDEVLLKHYLQEGREADALAIIENPKRSKEISLLFSDGRNYRAYEETPLSEKEEKLLLKLETRALQNDPNRSYWKSASGLSQKYGETGEFRNLMAGALADPRLTSPSARDELQDIHLTFLLEDGKADEGIKLLEDLLAKARKPAETTAGASSTETPMLPDTSSRHEQLLGRAIQLARLLGRTELLDRSLEEYSKLLPMMSYLPYDPVLWQSYIERNRGDLLEKGLSDRMARLAAAEQKESHGRNDLESPLIRLTWLYDQLGRHEDVIRLLDEGPFWSVPDLAEIDSRSQSTNDLLLFAAKAMKATGRVDKALEITRYLLRMEPGKDAGYLLLSQLNPPDQMTLLDEIAASNRFQERPLIWKAKLLLTQGKTDDAEATVKKAIAIDPSDGEQGKGDRMRAYDVLADILEKKGDAEQTKFFRSVVAAIRLSETADDWWTAGMTQKAIGIYEQALRSFADAYCIQSRLALRYANEDNMEKATQHYQRAFELMPDSFGRIESHCFGCEGAFTGKVAQSIAEKVFTGLAAKPDAKPQVFYLLGYLRNSQGRSGEAKEFFQKAVTMDPDYVNAWAKLGELSSVVNMSAAEQDDIAFNLFRLTSDPEKLSAASDLRRVWDAILTAEKNIPPPVKNLYPLKGAKEKISKRSNMQRVIYSSGQKDKPRSAWVNQPVMQGMKSILDAAVSMQ